MIDKGLPKIDLLKSLYIAEIHRLLNGECLEYNDTSTQYIINYWRDSCVCVDFGNIKTITVDGVILDNEDYPDFNDLIIEDLAGLIEFIKNLKGKK